jgi:hypothetical protein
VFYAPLEFVKLGGQTANKLATCEFSKWKHALAYFEKITRKIITQILFLFTKNSWIKEVENFLFWRQLEKLKPHKRN